MLETAIHFSPDTMLSAVLISTVSARFSNQIVWGEAEREGVATLLMDCRAAEC